MKIVSVETEAQAILTLLSSVEEVKTHLIQKLNRNHFSHRPSCLAYDLIINLIKEHFVFPTLITFLEHPSVTEEMKAWITKEGIIPVINLDDANNLFNILEYYRKLRLIYKLTNNIVEELNKDEKDGIPEIDEIINKIEKALVSAQTKSGEDNLIHIGKGGEPLDIINSITNKEKKELIPTTFDNFDKKVGGFERSSLLFLMSLAKGGKTTMAMNILTNQYLKHNLDVCYISIEMSKDEVKDCIVSMLSGVEHENIRKGNLSPAEEDVIRKVWKEFEDHGQKNNCRFSIWCPSKLSVMEMKLKLKPFNYDVICPDYINLMDVEDKNLPLHEKLNEIARQLKQAAKYLNAFIVGPAQMNKDGEVRYSKSLKEHANNIWKWFFNEEAEAKKQINVEQEVARGWARFSFLLDVNFDIKLVKDGYMNMGEEFNN